MTSKIFRVSFIRKHGAVLISISLLFWCSLPSGVLAASGDLDLTFGNAGSSINDISGNDDRIRDIAIQPDGKIIAVGKTEQIPSGLGFTVARYNAGGGLDASFGNSGVVLASLFEGEANAVALQPDGKIVAVGAFLNTSAPSLPFDFAIMRFDPNGAPDGSFGNNGKVATNFGTQFNGAYAVAIQPDSKIVVGGSRNSSNEFVLARYDSSGNLDPTFGVGGKVITPAPGTSVRISDLAIQADGMIVATAILYPFGKVLTDFTVARFRVDGTLDPTFGIGGVTISDFFDGMDDAESVEIAGDGKIVVAGSAMGPFPGTPDFAVARYLGNGTLDATFGAGGKARTDFGSGDFAYDCCIQPNGKIILAGTSIDNQSGNDIALVRYNADGSLDSSFGSGGRVTTNFGLQDVAGAVALQPDGKIIAAGNVWDRSSETGREFAVYRYLGEQFDICIQDESNGSHLQINSITGDYLFTSNIGVTASGIGALTKKGSLISLRHYLSDRRVLAQIDLSAKKATASIQLFSQGFFSITDRNTANNACGAP